MNHKKVVLIGIGLFCIVALFGTTSLEDGIEKYREGLYTQALLDFRDVITDPEMASYHGEGYFWMGKTYIALSMYDDAEQNIEYFLLNYKESHYYPEGMYQKGRLLFLQDDYENSIQMFYNFLNQYPKTPFTANSFFWIGESLFLLGQLDEAYRMFSLIVDRYPDNYKYEAARYRVALIDLYDREGELLTLLKISHEEYLKTLEDFQKKERTYEQALLSYQRKIADLSNTDSETEISELEADLQSKDNEIAILTRQNSELDDKVIALTAKVAVLEEQIEALLASRGTAAPVVESSSDNSEPAAIITDDQQSNITKLLQIKSEALQLKEEYLKYLYNLNEESEGANGE